MSKLQFVASFIVFLSFLVVVGYLAWPGSDDISVVPSSMPSPTTLLLPPGPTTTSSAPTDPIAEETVPSIPSETPIPSPTPTDIATEFLPPTPISTTASAPTNTAIPITIHTSTPSSIYGSAKVTANVRQGTSRAYESIGAVYQNDKVLILGRDSGGFWLQVEIAGGKTGWVVTDYVDLPIDIARLSVIPTPPPLLNPVGPAEPITTRYVLILRSASVLDELGPGREQDYTFFEDQIETVFILMFEPNLNSANIDYVQFVLYFRDAHNEAQVVGVGSRPGADRDGDLNTGELIWRGGPLTAGVEYHLRLINAGSEPIQYCLATNDIREWSCP